MRIHLATQTTYSNYPVNMKETWS